MGVHAWRVQGWLTWACVDVWRVKRSAQDGVHEIGSRVRMWPVRGRFMMAVGVHVHEAYTRSAYVGTHGVYAVGS